MSSTGLISPAPYGEIPMTITTLNRFGAPTSSRVAFKDVLLVGLPLCEGHSKGQNTHH